MTNQANVWDSEYSNHATKWKKERTSLPIDLKDKIVLEVGIGNGKNIPAILKQHPTSVYAIDISEKAIGICSKYKELLLKQESITKTSFKDNQFDVILCYYVLDNLTKQERTEAIQEIYRILKPQGTLIVENFLVGDYRQASKQTKKIEDNTLLRKNNIVQHFFTIPELKAILKEFKIKIKTHSFAPIKKRPSLKRKSIDIIAKKL
jgi:ubiquinone/menaquinone biosynthesis C-methylase UbiE